MFTNLDRAKQQVHLLLLKQQNSKGLNAPILFYHSHKKSTYWLRLGYNSSSVDLSVPFILRSGFESLAQHLLLLTHLYSHIQHKNIITFLLHSPPIGRRDKCSLIHLCAKNISVISNNKSFRNKLFSMSIRNKSKQKILKNTSFVECALSFHWYLQVSKEKM